MNLTRRGVAATAGAATVAAAAVLMERTTELGGRWERTNFRGRRVHLRGGLAAGLGSAVAAALATGPGRPGETAGAVLATTAGGVFGLLDDLDPTPAATRGLRGHLRALAGGTVTTGAAKLFGISGCAVAAAALLTDGGRRGSSRPASLPVRMADVLASGALIAGTANLINLFDLRPGRGLKVTTLLAGPMLSQTGTTGNLAAAAGGVAAASMPSDLGERTMLGDTGANALGALLGSAAATHPRPGVRFVALGAVVTLILASEKVSFSAVIAKTPLLRAIDGWGRQP
ncbi:hypothetical protein [Ruania rhizosphaerae]|uniref:hypothetical protein n=1 Tax=Ruania rhizosphaerae TaxID=1840413 RepID=UPI0013593335|nr:hypothetical protein [Ruania rhizosphaerae]